MINHLYLHSQYNVNLWKIFLRAILYENTFEFYSHTLSDIFLSLMIMM